VDAADVPLQRLVLPLDHHAMAGTQVCLRAGARPGDVVAAGRRTASPTCAAPHRDGALLQTHEAGAAPPRRARSPSWSRRAAAEAVLGAMRPPALRVLHVYGLTEVYGPAVTNEWHAEWNALPAAEQSRLMARQGVRYLPLEALDVMDPATMRPVPPTARPWAR
jgi:fatty-acyl-CoA synthase